MSAYSASLFCGLMLLIPAWISATCHQCGAREQSRIEDIKERMLASMGFNKAPPPGSFRARRELYKKNIDPDLIDLNDDNDEMTKILVMGKIPNVTLLPGYGVADFPLESASRQGHVVKATLQIPLRPGEMSEVRRVMINVKVIDLTGEMTGTVASREVHVAGDGEVRLTLPIGDVQQWMETGIYGIHVDARLDGTNIALHPQQSAETDDKSMVLILELERSKRERRWTSDVCKAEQQIKHCCRYDLTVDFTTMGWDFVLAPERYNAYMCRGQCSIENEHNSTAKFTERHMIYQHKYRQMQGELNRGTVTGLAQISTCCHPEEYAPLKVVYVNSDNEITITKINGMIATKCGCA